jgi:hypothetical protein
MLLDELREEVRLSGAGDGLEFRDSLLHAGGGIVIGLQEAGVGGDLIAAQAGLLVDDKRLDQGCQSYLLIRLFDQADGDVSAANLPDQDSGKQKTSDDRENHGLPEGPLESLEFQTCRLSPGLLG